jgi:hypothetical protein
MGRKPQTNIVKYNEIVENMFLGMGIEEQCKAFGVSKNALRVCNERRAILLKIQKVYNVNSILTGIPCQDFNFIRLPIAPKEFKELAGLIEQEEEKLKIPLEAV